MEILKFNEDIKKSAYKKKDVYLMSLNELAAILITTDGKGCNFKEHALQRLIEIIKENYVE